MVTPAFKDEVQFLAWGDGPQGPWIKLKLPDSDDLGPFRGMTQAKATMAGQRMACVLVEIGGDEKPVESAPAKPKGGDLSKLAGMLCDSEDFQAWLFEQHPDVIATDHPAIDAADIVRRVCGISSRAELDHNAKAAAKFHEIRKAWLEFSK